MLDLKFVLEDIPRICQILAKRGMSFDSTPLDEANQRRKVLQKEGDGLRCRQNQVSDEIARLKKEKKSADDLLLQMKQVAERVKEINVEVGTVETKVRDILLQLPNIPHLSVPVGGGAEQNVEIRKWGELPKFAATPKPHWEIGEALGILDFERAAKVSGARFTFYRGAGAALERALINFMVDLHTRERGYTEILPPFMVNDQSLLGTGQLPKFEAAPSK